MCEAQGGVDLRFDGKRVTGPGKESIPLSDHPVKATIKVDNREGGERGLGRDQGCVGSGRSDFLVEERNAECGAAEGFEDGERRYGLRLTMSIGGQGGVGLVFSRSQHCRGSQRASPCEYKGSAMPK